MQGTVTASFVFWLCTSPLIRYGCVWVYLTPAVALGGIYDGVMRFADCGGETAYALQERDRPGAQNGKNGRGWRFRVAWAVSAAVIFLLLYKGLALAREIAGSHGNDHWLTQKDYENYETYAYEIDGVTFYCPVQGDRVGYEAFPSSPAEAEITFLGEELKDGFRTIE